MRTDRDRNIARIQQFLWNPFHLYAYTVNETLSCKMEGGADMAYQPFYIVNAQNQENDWEALEEKDKEYMKGLYPQRAKEIQEKIEEECDKLEYEGSMMFDEYPDKLMIRNICERVYMDMQKNREEPVLYAEDEEETKGQEEVVSMDGRCSTCQRRPPFGEGPGFPPPRPPFGGGPGFPPPRPPYGGRPGFQPPQGDRPGFPPPQGGRPGFPPQGGGHGQKPRPCSCPPGRPCRDCLTVMQNQPDWMRDMIEVLLYQEMMHRRNRHRRRRNYRRNY